MLTRLSFDRRWFALVALFSLFGLMAIPTGDPSWLIYAGFLGFLAFLTFEKTTQSHA